MTNTRDYARERDADWATGAAMLISAECLAAVGPWDESFFLYSEETDYCLRARDRGFKLRYSPKATATHIGGSRTPRRSSGRS
ncbi:MAG: glycosyltransferase [Microthrixaceae bacterium]|nr:glycosyltransferase [Microthrixaceae bacterium]